MANVIIGIHGLDNKPEKDLLEKWWKEAIVEGLETYGYKSNLPKFELVYWADITYDRPLSDSEEDKGTDYYLEEKYVKAIDKFIPEDHSTRIKVVDFISRQLNNIFLNDDLSLNYSSITDKILNKYFKDLELYFKGDSTIPNSEKSKINSRLIDVLKKHKDDKIMVVGHSMGSIIAYNVLSFELPNIPIHSFITMGSPLALPNVISYIAGQQKKHNIDNPKQIKTPNSVTNNWCNFSDITDMVALNYKLSDDFAENNKGVSPVDFLVVNNYQINNKQNPHKSYGYLRTPEFAKVLNEFILSEKLSLKEKVVRAIKLFINKIK